MLPRISFLMLTRKGDVCNVLINRGGSRPRLIEFDVRFVFVLPLKVSAEYGANVREATLVKHMLRPKSGGRICEFTVYTVSAIIDIVVLLQN